jgi:septum formation protein
VDEDAVAAGLVDPTPDALVAALAEAKASAVLPLIAAEHDDAVIVGCDSMLLHNGAVLGKPGTVEAARSRWTSMAGTTGELLTGHSVIRLDGQTATATERTTVHFGQLSDRELDAYLATGEPLNVAGAFTIDGLGGWFVDGIEGDHTSVIGISLPLTRRLLAKVGVSVVNLWRNGTG